MRGGEVFIPKIPSMKVVDLARYIAPDKSLKIVGIRPGEKLHEAMSTEAHARNMLELSDRYIIVPELTFWNSSNHVSDGARRVEDSFRYASNTNNEWLTDESLRMLLEEAEE